MTDISENYQSYRGTQLNLTLCDLPIKRLLAYKRNQIYSEASSIHFQLLIYHILRSTHHNPHCSKYITTFQKTIRLLAEHNSIYTLRFIHQTPHISTINYSHFRKLSELSRNTIQFDTLRFIYQTLHTTKRNQNTINHLQHTFPHTIKHILTLYPLKS